MASGMTKVECWVERLVHSRHGLRLMFVVSFLEATVLPVPLELILIPYMLKVPALVWRIATAALLGCMAAATLGYYVGALLLDTVGIWLLETLNYTEVFDTYREDFQRHGFWAIILFGISPLQFQAAMLAAGAADYPLPLFWLASGISRGVLYYGIGLLVVLLGDRAVALWERLSKRAGWAVIAMVILVYFLIIWL